jgi:hypothetical protein
MPDSTDASRGRTFQPENFRVIATIAGRSGRTDLQIMATVRQQLRDSGFVALPARGRYDTEVDAIQRVCESREGAPVDGVLFVWYNRLRLADCTAQVTAYEIGGEGASIGITAMADRLIAYLRRGGPAPS